MVRKLSSESGIKVTARQISAFFSMCLWLRKSFAVVIHQEQEGKLQSLRSAATKLSIDTAPTAVPEVTDNDEEIQDDVDALR